MFGKGNFDGQFRTKPTVSIRGASQSENREQLLKRAHDERLNREAERSKSNAVLHIQSIVRGFLARRRVKRLARSYLVTLHKTMTSSESESSNIENIHKFGVYLLWCYNVNSDQSTFAWFSQLLVKHRQQLLETIKTSLHWQYLISRLINLAIDYVLVSQDNVASSLRLVQVFTDGSSYSDNGQLILSKIYKYLVGNNYYEKVRKLVDTKIPPVMEATTRAPTPLSQEVFQMIVRPLSICHVSDHVSSQILLQLCQNIFARQLSDQVKLFILPTLAENSFPLIRLLQTLSVSSSSISSLMSSPNMLFCFLTISRHYLQNLQPQYHGVLLQVLSGLVSGVLGPSVADVVDVGDEDDDDDDDDDMIVDNNSQTDCIIQQSIALLNDKEFVAFFVEVADNGTDQGLSSTFTGITSVSGPVSSSVMRQLCVICHQLLLHRGQAMYQYSLLYTLAFSPTFLRQLWTTITTSCQVSLFSSSPTPLISLLARGIKMSSHERDDIVPHLAVFSSLFGYLLVTIHDTEFYNNSSQKLGVKGKAWMPFSLVELVNMSQHLRDISLGLVELAFPESRPVVREDYRLAVNSVKKTAAVESEQEVDDVKIWSHLFKSVVLIVRQLYNRDTRRQFCPSNHWINSKIVLPQDRYQDISFRRSRMRAYRPFRGLRVFTRDELEADGPPLTTKEVRLATILRELPFTISFSQRVLVFQNLVQRDKQEHQGEMVNFMQGPHIDLMIRRNYIYEDSYDKLSKANEPNIKLKMRIQLVNAVGLDEAGIDGGGLFREFLSQLLKAAFDPNRGFFVLTKDQMLYPNPTADQIHGDSSPHYYFIGRILGKALYENLLVELPLAAFFLSKLLGQTLMNVDIDHLYSLDPELHRNLLYLKTYEGDVQDLGLDFTIAVDDFGENKIELLKPEGDEIAVTNENRIEYIHLVADFKLNKQIRQQCNAFRAGLSDVIGLDWLRMFSSKELSTLVAGAEHEINVGDLQAHTNYAGGYDLTHPTISAFWQVVGGLSEDQKRALLKFVTSCSRPPLLGFKDLDPPFCIQNSGSDSERLPTASTCMNLLKLPDFRDAVILKNKLLYAIESGAGFELS